MSSQKSKSFRTSLSLLVSSVLHASAVGLIALGPSFIPGLDGAGDRKATTVEFTVESQEPSNSTASTPTTVINPNTDTLADIRTVTVPQAQPKPVRETKLPQKAASKVSAPEAAAAAAVVAATASQSDVTQATEKNVDTANTPAEQPTEVAEETLAIDESAAAAGAAQEVTSNPPVNSTKSEAVATKELVEKAEEKSAPPVVKTEEIPTPTPAEKPIAAAGLGEGDAGATGSSTTPTAQSSPSTGAAASTPITQNYLGLRQQPGNTPPAYTRELRLQNLQGRGQLTYFVTKEGRVDQIKISKSTGSPVLDQTALDAFKNYKFVPGQEGYTVHDFEFSLKGPAQIDAGRLRTTMRN